MKKEYMKPYFDVSLLTLEDVLTLSNNEVEIDGEDLFN